MHGFQNVTNTSKALSSSGNEPKCALSVDRAAQAWAQQRSADLFFWINVWSFCPIIIMTYVLGLYTPALGRRLVLILPMLGTAIQLIIWLSIIYSSLPEYWWYIAAFVVGLSGSDNIRSKDHLPWLSLFYVFHWNRFRSQSIHHWEHDRKWTIIALCSLWDDLRDCLCHWNIHRWLLHLLARIYGFILVCLSLASALHRRSDLLLQIRPSWLQTGGRQRARLGSGDGKFSKMLSRMVWSVESVSISRTHSEETHLSSVDSLRLCFVLVYLYIVHCSPSVSSQCPVLLDIETYRQLHGYRFDLFRCLQSIGNEIADETRRGWREYLHYQSRLLRIGIAVDGLCSIELGDVCESALEFILRLPELINPLDDLQMVRTLGKNSCLHSRDCSKYDYESIWLLFL